MAAALTELIDAPSSLLLAARGTRRPCPAEAHKESIDLCQDFGHEIVRFYAAFSNDSSFGFVRSKNASITSAGIL